MKHFIAGAVLAGFLTAAAPAETLWIEGERPTASTMNRHPWWYDKVKGEELSGGEWISNFHDDLPGEATYAVNVPSAGAYRLWLRANPTSSAMQWRLGDGAWQEVGFGDAVDVRNVAGDGLVDLRFLGWVEVGRLDLAAGEQTLSFRTTSPMHHHGAIDVIVLTTEVFVPRGAARPEDLPVAQHVSTEDAWAFDPPEDDDRAGALLDLSGLNEDVAGATGFIRLSDDGMSFVRGNGEPIRFWGVVSGAHDMTPEQMERHARWLAKRGVNMVRFHMNLARTEDGAQITDVNAEQIDKTHRWVSIARQHGIYTTLSPYWAHSRCPESWGIEGYAGESPWGVLFFNPRFQEGYKAWTRALYTTPNPYADGLPLSQDPAVAIVQIKNEDSLLFWTFQGIKGEQKRVLGRQFHQWLEAKYGSILKARGAWGDAEAPLDDFANGVAGFYLIWDLTQPQTGGKAVRCADQTEFLTWRQREFYAEIARYLREDLGCRQLVNAMNWRSADQVLLDDAERYSYTATDVLAVNYYSGGVHVGENNGYRIDPGHLLVNQSVLDGSAPLPVNLKQAVGRPMIVTETAWVNPNLYQAEGPFLAAAYQSLSGVDALYWFAYGKPTWERDPRAMFWPVGDSHATHKWFGNFYGQAAMFPAYALAFRRGDIAAAPEPAVHEERSLADLWRRRPPIIAEQGRFDPNRDAGSFARESPVRHEVDRLAFFVGPVHVKYDGSPANTRVIDLKPYLDATRRVARSTTGQLTLDQSRGVASIDAPRVQGVCGFLRRAGGEFALTDVAVSSENDYAAIVAVSLDGEPIAATSRLLIQAGTTARLHRFTTAPAAFEADGQTLQGERIVSNGEPPWMVANTRAAVRVSNPSLSRATLLDANGHPRRAVETRRDGAALEIDLPADALYVVVE